MSLDVADDLESYADALGRAREALHAVAADVDLDGPGHGAPTLGMATVALVRQALANTDGCQRATCWWDEEAKAWACDEDCGCGQDHGRWEPFHGFPISDECELCAGWGFLRWQSYGYVVRPRESIPVQRCDACERFDSDDQAALACAAVLGWSTVGYTLGAVPDPETGQHVEPGDSWCAP